MPARRLPSTPPNLPGFTFVRVLGSGGFADVFLYQQSMPRRPVAIKVLLSEVVDDSVRTMFRAEANAMAQLSSHPSIMTVHNASVAPDGRPYLVMEHCSSALGERYRTGQLPVPEVLSIAIRIASALETAHRAGVLHRDVKPSNILLTAYGHPVLADFGIAASLSEADRRELVGLSVPWTAPEVLSGLSSGSVASEVWSMAATTYSLLAGRSPFEVAGDNNANEALRPRIARARMQPVDRPDAPARLVELLGYGMAKKPESRPRTMLEFIHELQAVETELGLSQTPIEVAMDDWALSALGDRAEQTAVRSALAPSGRNRRRRPVYAQPASQFSVTGPNRLDEATRARRERRRRLRWVAAAGVAFVVAVSAVGAWWWLELRTGSIPQVSAITVRIVDGGDVTGDGRAEFQWSDPGLRPGDQYLVIPSDPDVARETRDADQTSYTVVADDRFCISVAVVRDGVTGVPSAESCVTF